LKGTDMITNNFRKKSDYQEALKELLKPLKQCYSKGKALVFIGNNAAHYGEKTAGLEGFSRILWGLAPYWADGKDSELDDWIVEGITHGSNPEHPEYWGIYGDGEQAYVEMGALAYSLLMAPHKVWKPLDEESKIRFQNWLLQINHHVISDNNWLFFRVLVNCGLKKVNAEFSEEQLKKDLSRVDDFYLGDGWYSDGATKQRDYYVPFAMHFYGLLYAKLMEDEDPERSRTYKERAEKFAKDFIYYFGERGEALPYGRSLTYRFAQGCFWSALVYSNTEAFSWGVMKGILNRHFRWWFSQPILDHENKLTLGYAYPNLTVCEGYNSSQSPYWAMKTLLLLAVPEEHPFWQAEEELLPELDDVKSLPHAGLIIQRGEDGFVTALASGQYAEWEPVHCAEKYEKFAYSSYFGFQTPRSYYGIGAAAPDNMLAFLSNGLYFIRRRCKEVYCENDTLVSRWSPLEGVEVETTLRPNGKGHFRTHVIHSDKEYTAVEGGFSLPWREITEIQAEKGEGNVRVFGPAGESLLKLQEGEGVGEITFCEANVNLCHNRTVLPYLTYQIKKGVTKITVYVEGNAGNDESYFTVK